jgi:hypothetical protein
MNHKALNLLEEFFSLIDSEKLFESIDPNYYRRLRKEIFNALIQLLVWERPFLESAKGLPWPYEALRKRAHIFLRFESERQTILYSPTGRNFPCASSISRAMDLDDKG